MPKPYEHGWVIVPFLLLIACSSEVSEEREAAPARSDESQAEPLEAGQEPAEPVLTAEGWGPLRIGMTREQVVAALGPDANPEAVGGPEPESCDEFRPERAPEGMLVMIEEGELTRISIADPADIETGAGLSIGDSAEEIRAAYGERLRAEPHKYLEMPAAYLTVWSAGAPAGEGYTDDPAARGIRYETDEDGRVQAVHAGGPSIQYVEGCL